MPGGRVLSPGDARQEGNSSKRRKFVAGVLPSCDCGSGQGRNRIADTRWSQLNSICWTNRGYLLRLSKPQQLGHAAALARVGTGARSSSCRADTWQTISLTPISPARVCFAEELPLRRILMVHLTCPRGQPCLGLGRPVLSGAGALLESRAACPLLTEDVLLYDQTAVPTPLPGLRRLLSGLQRHRLLRLGTVLPCGA